MQTILTKAPGRSLNTPKAQSAKAVAASRALQCVRLSALCLRAATAAAKVLFSENATIAAAVILVLAMWWHNISISDPDMAARAVAADCLYAFPWLAAAIIRATVKAFKEGGTL